MRATIDEQLRAMIVTFTHKNIFAKSEMVPNPVAVRYAWRNWVDGCLFNGSLLPASSFRTDDWEDATLFGE